MFELTLALEQRRIEQPREVDKVEDVLQPESLLNEEI